MDDAIEEIKNRLAIEDVIGEYVLLKRSGRNFKGLSPFGNERTPSFVVSPEKQIWHDFSSGKGGSVFSFVMEMEGLDFKGSLEILARKAGIDLNQFQKHPGGNNEDQKIKLRGLLDTAAKFYQVQLKNNPSALQYLLKKRKFTTETIQAFRLGYAPDTFAALSNFLLKRGFTQKDIKQAGLSASRTNNPYDMFRKRIMVPLMDPFGVVIGFTARQLIDDPTGPKYINTPQTLLYDKSRHNFGLHLAKEAIRKSGFVVVVEGNLDVIASWQAGVRNLVASAGTAMTVQNLKSLSRFSGDIRLCFDADKAGQAAAERAIAIAQGIELQLSILDIPSGKDPDELIAKNPKLWTEAINNPIYAVDWLIERYKKSNDISTAQGKRSLSDAVLEVVAKLVDSVEQEHYIRKLAELLDVTPGAVIQKMKKGGNIEPGKRLKHRNIEKTLVGQDKTGPLQDCLLALVLSLPSLRKILKTIPIEVFTSQDRRVVYKYITSNPDQTSLSQIAQDLHENADYVKIVTLQFEELYGDLDATTLSEEFEKTKIRLIEQYVRNQKQFYLSELSQKEENNEVVQELLVRINKLDQLLQATLKE